MLLLSQTVLICILSTRDRGSTRSALALLWEGDRFESRLDTKDVKMVPTATISGAQHNT